MFYMLNAQNGSFFLTLNVEKCQMNIIMIPTDDHDHHNDHPVSCPCVHYTSKLMEEDLHLGLITLDGSCKDHAQVHANHTHTHTHTHTHAHTRTQTHTHTHTHTHAHTRTQTHTDRQTLPCGCWCRCCS